MYRSTPIRIALCLFVSLSIVSAQDKPRVVITTSDSWSMSGGFALVDGTGGGQISAGSSPQTVELIQNFMKSCPSVIVTSDRNNARYVVLFDRDSATRSTGWIGMMAQVNKIAVFKRNGDALYSGKTRSVASAVKDVCAAIGKNP